jgi:hypothetical protein
MQLLFAVRHIREADYWNVKCAAECNRTFKIIQDSKLVVTFRTITLTNYVTNLMVQLLCFWTLSIVLMNNVQKHNNCINITSSQTTFISY